MVSKLWLDLCGGGFIHLFNFNSTCNPLHLVCFYTRAKRLSKVKSLISQIRWKIFFSEKCLVTLPAAYSGPSTVRKCVSGYIPIGQVSSFSVDYRWWIKVWKLIWIQGIFLTVFSVVNFVIGMILSFNPNRKHLWANLILNLVNITTGKAFHNYITVYNVFHNSETIRYG